MRVTPKQSRGLVALFAGIIFMLFLLMAFGVAVVKSGASHILQYIWWMIATVSETLEMGIECFGWVLGRAVERFGKGFARGYHV
jgi:hypothetical protein